jgi:hypothetical protein
LTPCIARNTVIYIGTAPGPGTKEHEMAMFTTRTDAHTLVSNSGVANWEWGDVASADGFADWLWENDRDSDPDSPVNDEGENWMNDCLRAYLLSVGEDPGLFGV